MCLLTLFSLATCIIFRYIVQFSLTYSISLSILGLSSFQTSFVMFILVISSLFSVHCHRMWWIVNGTPHKGHSALGSRFMIAACCSAVTCSELADYHLISSGHCLGVLVASDMRLALFHLC
jgi:hypothetical protein